MRQIRFVTARTRLREAHVTDAPGRFDQMLARDLRIRPPTHAVIGEKAINDRDIDALATGQIDGRLTDNADISGWVETTHRGRS
jgi:hypothetical protein